MLTVTDKAARHLVESLARGEEDSQKALRIVKTDESYQLALDEPQEGDQVFQHDGKSYLVLDAQVDEALADAVLDVHESPHGTRITLTEGGTTS